MVRQGGGGTIIRAHGVVVAKERHAQDEDRSELRLLVDEHEGRLALADPRSE